MSGDTILGKLHSITFILGTIFGLTSHSLQLSYNIIPDWVFIFAALTPSFFIIAFGANEMLKVVENRKSVGFALHFHTLGLAGLLFAAIEMLSTNKSVYAYTRLNFYGGVFLTIGSASLVYLLFKEKVPFRSKLQFFLISVATILLLVSGILAYYTTYVYRIFSFLAFVVLIPAAINTIKKVDNKKNFIQSHNQLHNQLHGQPVV